MKVWAFGVGAWDSTMGSKSYRVRLKAFLKAQNGPKAWYSMISGPQSLIF